MKKNRIAILVTLILFITAGTLWLTNSYSTLKRNASDFSVQDTASITKIFLADKNNNQVLLERNADGIWQVDGKYLAQQQKVQSFLKTLKDIRVRNPVPLSARDNVLTRMSAIAKKIEIYQVVPRINLFGKMQLFPHEKNVKTYYIGDVTQDNQGTFMLMEGADDPFIVNLPGFRGFVASRYTTNPDEWRDFTVFMMKLGDIRTVRVEFPFQPQESYQTSQPRPRRGSSSSPNKWVTCRIQRRRGCGPGPRNYSAWLFPPPPIRFLPASCWPLKNGLTNWAMTFCWRTLKTLPSGRNPAFADFSRAVWMGCSFRRFTGWSRKCASTRNFWPAVRQWCC